jgi:hypothetical protein
VSVSLGVNPAGSLPLLVLARRSQWKRFARAAAHEMFTGQHFTSFVGSVRTSERQGAIERKSFVESGNSMRLPPPTPAFVLLKRWEAGSPADDAPESPPAKSIPSTPSTARPPTTPRMMTASSRGPHSARVQAIAATEQLDAPVTPRKIQQPLPPPTPRGTTPARSVGAQTASSEQPMAATINLDDLRGCSFNSSLGFLGGDASSSLGEPETRSAHPLQTGLREPLPIGWTERMSKKYPGRRYFYNSSTKQTTWSRPELGRGFPAGTQFFSSKSPRGPMDASTPRSSRGHQHTPSVENSQQQRGARAGGGGGYIARAPVSGSSNFFPHVGHMVVPDTPVGVKIGRSVTKLASMRGLDPFAGASGYYDAVASSGRGPASTAAAAQMGNETAVAERKARHVDQAAESAAKATAAMRASLRFRAAGVAGAATGGGGLPGALDSWAGQLGGSPLRR